MSGFFIFKKKIYTDNSNNLYLNGYKILADLIYSSKNPLKIVDQNIFLTHENQVKQNEHYCVNTINNIYNKELSFKMEKN